jgi:hypothetical protein
MRTTPFIEVFNRTVRLHGRDPRKEIPSDLALSLVSHMNFRVSTMVEVWRWPEWELTEERAFRQIWGATRQYVRVNTTHNAPDEVFYLGVPPPSSNNSAFGTGFGYYSVLPTAPSDPPVGTFPTNTTYFQPISPVDTFIEYDQPCKRAIGMVMGIYSQNPRIPTGSRNGLLKYAPSEKGIDVMNVGVPTVFVNYKMPTPSYTTTPWVTGKTYHRGDIVFDPATGECFQSLDTNTAAVSDVTHWLWVPFLSRWNETVIKGSFADSLMEFDQGGNDDLQTKFALQQYWSQDADDMFQQEVDKLAIEGQKLQWNFCKRPYRSPWFETQPFNGGSVTTLTDACEINLGFVYPFSGPTQSGCDTSYHSEIVSLKNAGGTPSLEGQATASLSATCTLIQIVIIVGGSPQVQSWRLDSGAANPLDGGQVAPLDYNATTNNKHWTKVG